MINYLRYVLGPASYVDTDRHGIAAVLARSDPRATEALMEIRLHANATTTPKQRAYLQASTRPTAELAAEIGVSEPPSGAGGDGRGQDRPHTPHRLATTLNPMQEFVVVELRKLLLLPPDDLLAVAREFVCPALSRSALDRCLRRHGVARAGRPRRRQKATYPRCPRPSRIRAGLRARRCEIPAPDAGRGRTPLS